MTRRFALVLLLALALIFTLAHAQETSPGEPAPTPTPDPVVPSEVPTPTVPVATPSVPSGTPTTTPTSTPIPNQPNPIFSTSDTCVACQRDYPTIRNCTALIPPPTVNLTMISQVLPFYNCICPNNGPDALQACSTCLRSTGQQSFLNPKHYNVTNQDTKALKQICIDTANGSRVPSMAGGHWDMMAKSASWTILSALALVVVTM
ncbi:hypothetical protein CPB97_010559 [Podila verticillata]|nr:hypothetical protein CPB97_010559 [Podila verticillata]